MSAAQWRMRGNELTGPLVADAILAGPQRVGNHPWPSRVVAVAADTSEVHATKDAGALGENCSFLLWRLVLEAALIKLALMSCVECTDA